MAVTVRQLQSRATIVTVEGVSDASLLRDVLDAIDQGATDNVPVVLDIDDLLLLNRAGIGLLVAYLDAANRRVRLVSSRLSARRILRRYGASSLHVYPTVEQALRPMTV